MKDSNKNEAGAIRKVIMNEVTLVMAIVGVVSSLIFWVANPQTELEKELIKLKAQVETNKTVATALAEIKNNDLHEFQLRLEQIENRQIDILRGLSSLETLITIHSNQ